mmetsp:Transcript_1318/g.2709  ORF Transcript_1318/g.2709 Transcript_1318/m.2709 type:complete len:272 (+) Transcript_1318:200-1015(+)
MGASKKSKQSRLLVCTACDRDADAESLHPLLRVPVCGACSSALCSADRTIVEGNDSSCCWCGCGDDNHLFMCDGCVKTVCSDCVARNFGRAEAQRVRALQVWLCYCCAPTRALEALQVAEDVTYYNIDRAYAALRPPPLAQAQARLAALRGALGPAEAALAALLADCVCGVTIEGSQMIGSYLTALDLAAVWRVSHGMRRLFQRQKFLVPGLFKTPYGEEHQCKLFDHQTVSLSQMCLMENACTDFGAMRGGIFGDEPGLGKTVTSLVGVT